MTGCKGLILVSVFGAFSNASVFAQAESERAFGQLKPGQSVVEINQSALAEDSGWSPVLRSPVDTAESDFLPEGTESLAFIPPNVAPVGGTNILEELANRQAEADAASRAQAQRLSTVKPSLDTFSPTVAETATLSTATLSTAPQESKPLGPSILDTTSTSDIASTGTDAHPVPTTNFARDWFQAQNPAVQAMLALGTVILLIYALAWVYRKMAANRGGVTGINAGKSPSGLLEVLGRYPMGNKQSLVLLKFDRRVLLLAQGPSGKGGMEMTTLCELDEPEDVASVLMKVRDADGDSLNKAFRSAMSRAELGAGASDRMIEPKPIPAPERAPTPPPAQVVPGHRDPFSGYGGDFVGATRKVNTTPEGDRSELWGEPPAANTNDPVASLRERLEAMRRGERVK